MDVSDRRLKSEYGGREYVFCSESCRQKFDRDPGRYVK